jgi:hypothetical protein
MCQFVIHHAPVTCDNYFWVPIVSDELISDESFCGEVGYAKKSCMDWFRKFERHSFHDRSHPLEESCWRSDLRPCQDFVSPTHHRPNTLQSTSSLPTSLNMDSIPEPRNLEWLSPLTDWILGTIRSRLSALGVKVPDIEFSRIRSRSSYPDAELYVIKRAVDDVGWLTWDG